MKRNEKIKRDSNSTESEIIKSSDDEQVPVLPERRIHFPLIDVLRLDWTNEIDLLKSTMTSDIHIAPMISTKYTTSTVMSENERLHAFEELRKLRQCEEYNFISKDL